jgi:xylulokinase
VLGVTLGTAGHVVLSSPRPLLAPSSGIWQIAHMVERRMIWLGLIMAGGLSLSWLYKTMSLGRTAPSFEEFVALADGAEPGARGLIFLPFLEGAATPYEKPAARAAFAGLTSSHGAAEMIQAVMEGVAFNLRECVELFERLGVNISEIRLAEGGSRVARWCQIIADVLGRPVNLIEEPDTSALGAAMAAQAGAGHAPLERIAENVVRVGGRFHPTGNAYDLAYRNYRELAQRSIADTSG